MIIKDFSKLEKLLDPYKIYNLFHFNAIAGFSIDSRSIKKGDAFIALKGKLCDGHDFIKDAVKNGASCVIAEKEIGFKCKVPVFLIDDAYVALAKICRYVREKKNPVVYAISGSVGKTTTKEMLYFLLEKDFSVLKNYKTENNVLGVAKTIFSLNDEKVLILELGTNHPGEIGNLSSMAYPDTGIITFVKPVHLEGLKSLEGVFREKTELLRANPRINAVLNRDDAHLRKVNFCKNTFWFGKNKECNLYAKFLRSDINESVFLIQNEFELRLSNGFPGFIYNALSAILAASLMRVPVRKLVERLNDFKDFPSQRMEMKKINNLVFMNDAYNSNPYAFCEALHMVRKFPLKKIAVVADMLELGPKSEYYHRKLARPVIHAGFDYVLTFGKYSAYLKDDLKKLGYKNAYHFSSCEDIADFIGKYAKQGSLVFLKGSRGMQLEKVLDLVKTRLTERKRT
ncbi:MAG: UDP-N-acetylmuramoyl-tripeptide--D-alanyl-D-alanine ligase [Candidatus Omnitrophota bacterium]|jgi:UDP-N-acetylmuramoyl-tripeptide--D-alanyl-D-alanine ligase